MKSIITGSSSVNDTSCSLRYSSLEDRSEIEQSEFLDRQRKMYFKDLNAYPEKTIFLGFDLDILPVLLDLTRPKSGSILFFTGINSKFKKFITNICSSSDWKNNRDHIVFGIISPDADDYIEMLGFPGCQFILNPYERTAAEIIFELSGIAEQRKYGRERGPAMILIIDDLWSYFCYNSDYGTFINLRWLISYGPNSQIWPIVSIQLKDRQKFKEPLLNLFGTIISEIRNQPDNLLPAWQSQYLDAVRTYKTVIPDHILNMKDSTFPLIIP